MIWTTLVEELLPTIAWMIEQQPQHSTTLSKKPEVSAPTLSLAVEVFLA